MSNILNWIRSLFNKDKQSKNEIQRIKDGSSYVQFAAIEGLTLEGIGKIFKGNKNDEKDKGKIEEGKGQNKDNGHDNGNHNGWDKDKDKDKDKENGHDNGNHNGNDKGKPGNSGNNGKHLGWYKRADHPKNPGNLPVLNKPDSYEVTNYVNDISMINPQVLMTSDREGTYRATYTYGLERISVRDLVEPQGKPNNPLYYLYDGHGSVTQLANKDGNVKDKYRYDPYGAPMPGGKFSPNTKNLTNPYGYNGEDYDIDSELQFLRARYYEPEDGRFLTRDSYLGSIMEPLSLNRYSYVNNNPIMYNDPTGHFLGKVGSWLKSAATSVIETGKQIYNAVSNTISNAVSYVVEKVKDVASNANQKRIQNRNKREQRRYDTPKEKKIRNSKGNSRSTGSKRSNYPSVGSPYSHISSALSKMKSYAKNGCEGLGYIGKSIGSDPFSFVLGMADSAINNVFFGLNEGKKQDHLRDIRLEGNDKKLTSYYAGNLVGNAFSMVVGQLEKSVGQKIALSGVGVTVGSGGTLTWGGVSLAVAGQSVVAVGTATQVISAVQAGNDLNNLKDSIKFSEGTGNPVFKSEDLLDSHYQKHVVDQGEFGNITKDKYLKDAQDLVTSKPGGDILTKTRTNGDTIFYNKATNEFAVTDKSGSIKTYFKPTDGIDYYNGQK